MGARIPDDEPGHGAGTSRRLRQQRSAAETSGAKGKRAGKAAAVAAVYFDGTTWQRMDPTYASTSKQSASVMAFIGDSKNYTTKYLY